MMHEGELEDKCALCGKILGPEDDETTRNLIIEEIIQDTHYKFDTRDCATMFKRFLGVYGKEFQPFLGDQQYLSDPFWDRVVPKENEIKELEQEEEKKIAGRGKDVSRGDQKKSRNQEVVSIIKDSFQVQKLINQLIGSAKDAIALAVPNAAADIFFYPQGQTSSSESCSMFFHQIKDVAAVNKQLDVKIVTNAPSRKIGSREQENNPDILTNTQQEELSNIHIKNIEQDYSSLNQNMVILVVDRKDSLAIELEDDGSERAAQSTPYRMIKLATHSSNKSTVLSYLSIFETLWKEIEVNETIIGLLDEIKARENIEKDFISMAAHELRAPIQPVLGLAQILQSKKNVDTKEHEELLAVIIRNARRLNIITKNLLDLTKIESNTLKLQKEIFNLSDIIFEALADMKSQLSSNQIVVNVESNNYQPKYMVDATTDNKISGHRPYNNNSLLVLADKARIMQVVSNLLYNAISFTKEGTIEISLENKNIDMSKGDRETEEGERGGQRQEVIVSFTDSGTGIDPEIIDRLFEKFVSKSDKGTGLGLFICKNIIQAHGGRIWAENNPRGNGATFAFSLPKPIGKFG